MIAAALLAAALSTVAPTSVVPAATLPFAVAATVPATVPVALPAVRPPADPRADDPGPAGHDDPLQLAEVARMVERSHRFLLANQNPDGSFDVVRSQASSSAPIAVTALTALSLMASGQVPDPERGRHGLALTRALDWLVDRCDDRGYFYADGDEISRMHGQGYALLALTQAHGMYVSDAVQRRRLHDAIERGVHLIETAQGTVGGWYYDPTMVDAHEGSITVCMIQALRAARDAGFAVDPAVIEHAQLYMWRSQNPESGRFKYALNDQKESWPLTAAALSTLNAMGDYGSERMQAGFDALERDDPFLRGHGWPAFLQYGTLYAAQAYWHHRDRQAFERWWQGFVDECRDLQRADGSFSNGQYGAVYGTAITSLTLQVPLGYLPIFQR